ncbi:MAG: hypothetical protein KGI19_04995 [Thaumarchaeota archaeon]|nr:hypothetical protein [Nitrososphaerota archaeon]
MVDVVQRPPGRICEIVRDKGMMKWEYDERLVKINSPDKKKWVEYPEKLDYKGYKIEKPKRGFAIKNTRMT